MSNIFDKPVERLIDNYGKSGGEYRLEMSREEIYHALPPFSDTGQEDSWAFPHIQTKFGNALNKTEPIVRRLRHQDLDGLIRYCRDIRYWDSLSAPIPKQIAYIIDGVLIQSIQARSKQVDLGEPTYKGEALFTKLLHDETGKWRFLCSTGVYFERLQNAPQEQYAEVYKDIERRSNPVHREELLRLWQYICADVELPTYLRKRSAFTFPNSLPLAFNSEGEPDEASGNYGIIYAIQPANYEITISDIAVVLHPTREGQELRMAVSMAVEVNPDSSLLRFTIPLS